MVDVEVTRSGNVFMFLLLTPAAKEWVAENVETEGWQWLGDGLVVDHDYAPSLAMAMLEAGLVVQ